MAYRDVMKPFADAAQKAQDTINLLDPAQHQGAFGADPSGSSNVTPTSVARESISMLDPRTGLKKAANSLINNVEGEIQGLNPFLQHGKYVTGARAIIRINGKLAAFAFSVSWSIRTEQDEIWTIDDYLPYEMAPKRITVDGSIGGFHIPNETASTMMAAPTVLSFLFHKYITIEIRDRTTDAVLFKTNKAVITSTTESIQADQLATVNLTWKAIGWQDEMRPEPPTEKGAKPKNASKGGWAGADTQDKGSRIIANMA